MPPANLQVLDAQHHLHPFSNNGALGREGARIIVRGEGSYLYDIDGARILDGMSGLWTTNVGYGRIELAEAAYRQMKELAFYNTFFKTSHPRVIELAKIITDRTGPRLDQIFFGTSGSDSNDTAIRLIRHYWALKGEPQRRVIISRHSAYHGSTIASSSMGGFAHVHQQTYPVYDGFRHIMDPYAFEEAEPGETLEAFGQRAAQALETEIKAIGPGNVAAFAFEPVQCAGGVKIAPDSYWPEIQRIADRYGILLLADEVITGFGRMGNWFGHSTLPVRPHLVTFAKAVTSGYIPLSGVIVHDVIADVLRAQDEDFNHGYTFAGHPTACAVALENIRLLESENLVASVNTTTGPALRTMLNRFADHPLVGEVRTTGLLGAIELVADKKTNRRFDDPGRVGLICRDHFFRENFIMRAINDTIVCAPPLIWGTDQFTEAENTIAKVLDLTLRDVRDEVVT